MLGKYRVHKPLQTRWTSVRFPGVYLISGIGQGGGGAGGRDVSSGGGGTISYEGQAGSPGSVTTQIMSLRIEFPVGSWSGAQGWGGPPGMSGNRGNELTISTPQWSFTCFGGWPGSGPGSRTPVPSGHPNGGTGGAGGANGGPGLTGSYGGFYAELRG